MVGEGPPGARWSRGLEKPSQGQKLRRTLPPADHLSKTPQDQPSPVLMLTRRPGSFSLPQEGPIQGYRKEGSLKRKLRSSTGE